MEELKKLTIERTKEEFDKLADTLEAVSGLVDVAISWWESKRPIRYTEKEHLENYAINCVTKQEMYLAKAVAELIEGGWK